MLRREAEPEPAFVEALAAETTHRMVCESCGETGLVRTEAFDDFDVLEAKDCVACGVRIPPERLELFPDSIRCAACTAALENGQAVGNDREFCSRCGDVLRMRTREQAVTRYQMYCPSCGARG